MPRTASDILIETIHDWGVDTVFGIPGDGINGLMESLRTHQDTVRFVQVRHEEAAALMACAHAKFTGKLGCCIATTGPGGIHLLNGLYDAKLDGQPVLALTGLTYHDLIGTHTQQDVALDRLFQDVCVYNERIMGRAHVENVTELACRTALSYRGVAHLTIPIDVQEEELDKKSPRNVSHHVSDVLALGARLPNHGDLERAAEVLNKGKRIAILAGQGALGSGELLEDVADRLSAPIVKALLGRAVVPDDSPYTTGCIGLLGTKASQEALEECDTLLMVGSSFPYIEFLPKPGQARVVQIDIDPVRIGLRQPVDVGVVGDAHRSLKELLPLLKRNKHRRFLEQAQAGMKDWRKLMNDRGTRSGKPMKPQVVAHEIGKRLPENAIVTCDSGTITTWWARHIPVKRGQMHSVSGNLATMGCALPYANAAQLAYPNRTCVAFVGDGGFSMLMGEFLTAVKYKLPVKVFVVHNNVLGQIKWEQMVFLGNPEYGVDLQTMDYAMFARACGATGFRVEDPEEMPRIAERALATEGPVLVDAIVDGLEPPMPGKITARQAAKFAESLLKGQPNRTKIALTVAQGRIREMI
ncbi:MAG TPA: thiamine pyrophosphate-dependent enzyme [Bryobacteraceae bacterium]|nr:thiamine pyrophosphate-dependent enzyme [Bryobacteraceae bacterium]